MHVKWLLTQYQQGHETCDHSTNNTYHVPPTVPGTFERGQILVLCPCPSAIASCHLAIVSFQRMKASGEDGEDGGAETQRGLGLRHSHKLQCQPGQQPSTPLVQEKRKMTRLPCLTALYYALCSYHFKVYSLCTRKRHNKENSTNCQNTERTPKLSNLNKMKRQRNTQQIK